MSTYAIGDLQGCYSALMSLLQHIQFKPGQDKLWFVGDIINRGPESLQALRFVRDLKEHAVVVAGNHDLALLAVSKGYYKPKKKDTFQEILDAPDADELLQYLRDLPFAHVDRTLNTMMVHAGIPPAWTQEQALALAEEADAFKRSAEFDDFLPNMIADKPTSWSDDLNTVDRMRFIFNAFTRMRFVDEKGNLDFAVKGGLSPDNEEKAWFNAKSRDKDKLQIVFGHWAAIMGFCPRPHIHALDTGCVWGGALTAYRLEDGMRFSIENGG